MTLPGDDAVTAVLAQGMRALNFIPFARALLDEARSYQTLIAGDLLGAAAWQQARGKILDQARLMHLQAGTPLHDDYARRLAADMDIAWQRQANLSAKAKARARRAWLWPLLFFVMAIGSVVLIIHLSGRFELVRNRWVFALLLLFVMAVSGIGARQVQWQNAANWLKEVLGQLPQPGR